MRRALLATTLLFACGGEFDAPPVETTASALSSTPWTLAPPGSNLWAVAIHGDRAAVTSDETIRIYDRVWFFGVYLWLETAQIPEPPSRYAGAEFFGSAIDLYEDRLIAKVTSSVVGSRVLVYERQSDGTWSLAATFGPVTGGTGNEVASYGESPKIAGDTAVWGQSYASSKRGRVFVARRDTQGVWALTQTIDGPGANTHQYFGQDIVLQNDLLAVGAPGFYEPGHVYVYARLPLGDFALEVDLPDPTSTSNARFGQRIGFDNTNLVVRNNASHYVYRRTLQYIPWWAPFPTPVWSPPSVWNLQATGELSTYFGKTAIGVDAPGQTLGRVQIYDMTIGTPTLSQTIDAPSGAQKFGQYVDLHNDRLIVGGGNYSQPGGAFVY